MSWNGLTRDVRRRTGIRGIVTTKTPRRHDDSVATIEIPSKKCKHGGALDGHGRSALAKCLRGIGRGGRRSARDIIGDGACIRCRSSAWLACGRVPREAMRDREVAGRSRRSTIGRLDYRSRGSFSCRGGIIECLEKGDVSALEKCTLADW